MQLRLELLLQSAQAVIVHAHIAQHLRGNLVVRIEALELFGEVDALDMLAPLPAPVPVSACTRAATSGVTLRATQAKLWPLFKPGGNLLFGGLRIFGVGMHHGGQRMRGGLLVVNFEGTA